MYNEEGQRSERGGEPVLRPANAPPPCRTCEKLTGIEPKNPEAGEKFGSLSPKNWLTLRLYFQHRARAAGKVDTIVAKNLGIIEQLVFFHETHAERMSLDMQKIALKTRVK